MLDFEPRIVWSHFATLCATPRPSKHEAALRDRLRLWADGLGLEHRVDAAGNLILRKPASPGAEDRPGVILQGHLDMVCQQNAGSGHDFLRDPIRPVARDGWLMAEHTTLGADNGIGVALALAALEAPGLVHPPLEVLLTVDEEAGMGGARALTPNSLAGRYLINLDTEEWGEFYLGCAGGMDVEMHRPVQREPLPAGWSLWRLELSGLMGGHSGIDIHRGRGNAIVLLLKCLKALAEEPGARIVHLAGGTARNAIPREAGAIVAVPEAGRGALLARLLDWSETWQRRLAGMDPGLRLQAHPLTADAPEAGLGILAADHQSALLALLSDLPNGVQAMSGDFAGVVETSDNLGVLNLDATGCQAVIMVRSLKDSEAHLLADRIIRQARDQGATAEKRGPYPGWPPNPGSPLLALAQRVYQQEFSRPAGLQVIHAGLECGLLGASHPHLDMISFGPDIRGAHAPGERVEIASVAHCWRLLRSLLAELACGGAGQR